MIVILLYLQHKLIIMIEIILIVKNQNKVRKLVKDLLDAHLIINPLIQAVEDFDGNEKYKITAITRAFLYREIDQFFKDQKEDVLIYSKPIVDMDFAHSQKLLKNTKAA